MSFFKQNCTNVGSALSQQRDFKKIWDKSFPFSLFVQFLRNGHGILCFFNFQILNRPFSGYGRRVKMALHINVNDYTVGNCIVMN